MRGETIASPERAWPADGLEQVGACPLCGEPGRTLLLDGLTDTVFKCAPGVWTMWRCEGCGVGYLDPRPNAATVHLAYGAYYTHDEPAGPSAARTWRQRLRRLAQSAYLERYHGRRRAPLAWFGPLVRRTRPRIARALAYTHRHLRPPPGRSRPRLLDIGCGNGAFLRLARQRGWDAFGCDFDPAAVEQARSSGAEVRLGGAEAFAGEAGTFDAVSLSHVIEHVHDPRALLDEVFALLAPGGQVFIDTPSVEALGLARYGPAWRGLEPPRHLVLFNWQSLRQALGGAGFVEVTDRPQPELAEAIWRKSDRLRAGKDPYDETSPYSPDVLEGLPPPAQRPRLGAEFVTITARKPR